ncbi:MAG: two-component regulator propeller domain-containing protein [Candidatus Omnitrophota bacterium]
MVKVSVVRFLFFLLWATATLVALDPHKQISQYNMQVWNMDSGLPGNAVFAIRQTPDGYLWLGTSDGLVRFDGVTLLWYSREKFPQVKIGEIRALHVDRNGTLWIGTSFDGLIRYKDGEFRTYPVATHKSLLKISAIEEDAYGNLWIGSFTSGLTCVSKAGQFNTYSSIGEVRSISKDDKGNLWITTKTGIVQMSKPGVFQVKVRQTDFSYYLTRCLYNVDSNELWIGTGDHYLNRLKNDKYQIYGPVQGLMHPTISCLYEDRDKNLWVGTDGGSLVRVNKSGVSSMKPGSAPSIPGSIYSIYEDREGSLWVGTLDEGLYRFRDSKFTTVTTREGLVHDYIQCACEDREGNIWIGTKGGLNRFKNGKVDALITKREGLLDPSVTGLLEGPDGSLWIGTWAGLHRYQNGRITALTDKNGLSDNRIGCIRMDKQGNLWIGTPKGLTGYNPDRGVFATYTKSNGLSHDAVECIYIDSKGRLWIGTDSGLDCLIGGIIAPNLPRSVRIGKKMFHCAHEDRDGVLWFGTESGLVRLKENEKRVDIYTTQNGLFENYVHSILSDDNGNLWLGGRNGVSRVRKQELEELSAGTISRLHPIRYNEKDGMKSRWCSGSAIKTREARFWMPTTAGVVIVDPGQINANPMIPPVIIETFVADDKPIDLHGLRRLKKPLALGPGIERLEFHYTGTSLIDSQDVRYKVRLSGYDNHWIDMGHTRYITYTHLSPGAYTLRVMAANADGVWNHKGAVLSFSIRPYFYQTTWFRTLMVLLVLLGIHVFYKLKFRRLHARQEELARLVALRTADLQERNLQLEGARQNIEKSKELIEVKNLQLESQTLQLTTQSEKLKEMDRIKSRFFANISHEFRTPLTLIMGPLEQMLAIGDRDPKERKNLSLMLHNSQRLLGLINQLLSLSKLESGKMKLKACPQNVIPFLKVMTENFGSLAESRELELAFVSEESEIIVYMDAEKLEEIISNLLMNAVKFTPKGGKITVTARRVFGNGELSSGEMVQLSVSDTGPGISREQLVHIFDRFYQAEHVYENREKGSGIGLALVKELVHLHHGTIDVHSREGEGTKFIVSLPLGKGHFQPEEIDEMIEVDTDDFHEVVDEGGIGVDETDETENEPLTPNREIILLVEDSEAVRGYIRGALAGDYRVIEATEGRDGIRQALAVIPDLIISDIMMPGCDGYELCRTLKKDIKTSHIPIILLTAKASEENVVQGLDIGADDYVTKPFSIKILMARVRNLIESRRRMQLTIHREMALNPVDISVSGIDKTFLKELKDVINNNLSDPEFNVEGLAKKLSMDRSTVYRKVLALTGEVPTELIKTCRLKRAADVLKTGNYGTILDVALAVGFSSANYFTRCFKQKFDCLPSIYQVSQGE